MLKLCAQIYVLIQRGFFSKAHISFYLVIYKSKISFCYVFALKRIKYGKWVLSLTKLTYIVYLLHLKHDTLLLFYIELKINYYLF